MVKTNKKSSGKRTKTRRMHRVRREKRESKLLFPGASSIKQSEHVSGIRDSEIILIHTCIGRSTRTEHVQNKRSLKLQNYRKSATREVETRPENAY